MILCYTTSSMIEELIDTKLANNNYYDCVKSRR